MNHHRNNNQPQPHLWMSEVSDLGSGILHLAPTPAKFPPSRKKTSQVARYLTYHPRTIRSRRHTFLTAFLTYKDDSSKARCYERRCWTRTELERIMAWRWREIKQSHLGREINNKHKHKQSCNDEWWLLIKNLSDRLLCNCNCINSTLNHCRC